MAKTYGAWNLRRGSYDTDFHTYALEWTEEFMYAFFSPSYPFNIDNIFYAVASTSILDSITPCQSLSSIRRHSGNAGISRPLFRTVHKVSFSITLG